MASAWRFLTASFALLQLNHCVITDKGRHRDTESENLFAFESQSLCCTISLAHSKNARQTELNTHQHISTEGCSPAVGTVYIEGKGSNRVPLCKAIAIIALGWRFPLYICVPRPIMAKSVIKVESFVCCQTDSIQAGSATAPTVIASMLPCKNLGKSIGVTDYMVQAEQPILLLLGCSCAAVEPVTFPKKGPGGWSV